MAVRSYSLSERSAYVSDDDDSTSTLGAYSSEDEQDSARPTSVKSLKRKSEKLVKSFEHDYAELRNTCYIDSDEEPSRKSKRKPSRDASWSPVSSRKRSRDDSKEKVPRKKKRCESKNAINARLNREKKKAYTQSLETEIDDLRAGKKESVRRIAAQDVLIRDLKQEVLQLKCLLANNKYLGALVSKLSECTGLPVTSSIFGAGKSESPTNRSVPSVHEISGSPKIKSVPKGKNHPISHNDAFLNNTFIGSGLTTTTVDPAKLHVNDFDLTGESLFPSLDDFNPSEFLPLDCLGEYDSNVGLCVHINQNRLSVEFCPVCNSRAISS